MISWFDMKKRRAKLTICDLDSNTCAEYRIPLPKVEKANTTEAMKTIGALQTYAERYLYLQAFEIVVPDTIEQERPTTFKPQNIREQIIEFNSYNNYQNLIFTQTLEKIIILKI